MWRKHFPVSLYFLNSSELVLSLHSDSNVSPVRLSTGVSKTRTFSEIKVVKWWGEKHKVTTTRLKYSMRLYSLNLRNQNVTNLSEITHKNSIIFCVKGPHHFTRLDQPDYKRDVKHRVDTSCWVKDILIILTLIYAQKRTQRTWKKTKIYLSGASLA